MTLEENLSQFVGIMVLVGLCYYDEHGSLLKQTQVHCLVRRANEKEGIVIWLKDGEKEFKLPPDISRLQHSPEGEFREYSTGKTIENPDYITFWNIHREVTDDGETWAWKPGPRIQFPEPS